MNLKPVRLLPVLTLAAGLSARVTVLQASPRGFAPNLAPTALLEAPPEGPAEGGKGETRELIFKTINFLILAGALAYLLRKPLSDFFAQRSADIQADLEEGRKALAESQARLSAVEEKLRRLDEEIAAFKASALREMQAEHQRMLQAAQAEAEKILESARSRMETMARAAKLDLRRYAAEQALTQAEQIIRARMDDATRHRLVSRFVETLQ